MTRYERSLVNIAFTDTHANEVGFCFYALRLALPANNEVEIITLKNNCEHSDRVQVLLIRMLGNNAGCLNSGTTKRPEWVWLQINYTSHGLTVLINVNKRNASDST